MGGAYSREALIQGRALIQGNTVCEFLKFIYVLQGRSKHLKNEKNIQIWGAKWTKMAESTMILSIVDNVCRNLGVLRPCVL